MKADKNGNGKIEIGELTNFLKEYRSIRSKIQGQPQVKAGVVEPKIEEEHAEEKHEFQYQTIATNISRPVRKLVIMNDRS